MLENVSIIIPVHKSELYLEILLAELEPIKGQAEIIISSEGTRAKSLNQGAKKATREFLWFLHADSQVSSTNIEALQKSLKELPDALHYFVLRFDKKASFLMPLNAWGANLRSKFLGMPYGDQGLCLSKNQFELIGGYPEDVPYGEDLVLVLRAKKLGIKLNKIPSKLLTSARKYQEYGWLKVTLLYQLRLTTTNLTESFGRRFNR
jgi:GT2 family glycosyltransferase